MRTARALAAANPLQFGRGPARLVREEEVRRPTVSDEMRLFGTTFAAGFLFVSILIA